MADDKSEKKRKQAQDNYTTYRELSLLHLAGAALIIGVVIIVVSNVAKKWHDNPPQRAKHLDRGKEPQKAKFKAKRRGYKIEYGKNR